MRRTAPTRRREVDLIPRLPLGGVPVDRRWDSLIIDPTRQLKTWRELFERGLLSEEEYAAQRARVLSAGEPIEGTR